jgi:hypothetical protein
MLYFSFKFNPFIGNFDWVGTGAAVDPGGTKDFMDGSEFDFMDGTNYDFMA